MQFPSSIVAMPFDWLVELAAPISLPLAYAALVPPPQNSTRKISFVQALSASSTICSNENLPQPLILGDSVSIKITQDMYEKGLAVCKRNLRGRLVLNKGNKPYTTRDIQLKIHHQLKIQAEWSMRSLGRGYYEFTFPS